MITISALLAALAASFFVMNGSATGAVTANIYKDGKCIHSIDLSAVGERYTIHIGGGLSNTVIVEKGRICIADATCPDHICVRQGWISNGIVPIVCLPNNIVIQIEGAPESDIDAMSH